MQTIGLSWGTQPAFVRCILLSQLALVVLSGVRFARAARRLYLYSGEPVLPEGILKGETSPELLAASALAGRLPLKKGPDQHAWIPWGEASSVTALDIVHTAGSRFAYFCERCDSDVGSTKRASLLAFVLSLVTVAYGAFPMYAACFNNSNRTGYSCLFWTVERLLVLLAVGWSCCALLFFVASFFERTLTDRRISWRYFCSGLKDERSYH
jgi:hypothetical protein